MKVIHLIGLANGEPSDFDDTYLVHADISNMELLTTRDPRHALTFPHASDAIEFWRRIDPKRPIRPDGKPNRPLTAYSVAIENSPHDDLVKQ